MYERAGYRRIERYNDNPYAHHWFAKAQPATPTSNGCAPGPIRRDDVARALDAVALRALEVGVDRSSRSRDG